MLLLLPDCCCCYHCAALLALQARLLRMLLSLLVHHAHSCRLEVPFPIASLGPIQGQWEGRGTKKEAIGLPGEIHPLDQISS